MFSHRYSRIKRVGTLVCAVLVICIFAFAPLGIQRGQVEIHTARAEGLSTTEMLKIVTSPSSWLATGAYGMLLVSGSIAGVGGIVLNQATKYTVAGLGDTLRGGGDAAVTGAWKILRDLGNIVIIFSLLVIGIATILRITSYGMKSLLVNVLIVALLINFSLFFTKAIIDAGNLVTHQIYVKITEDNGCGRSDYDSCLSDAFMDKLALVTLYDIRTGISEADFKETNKLGWKTIVIVGVLGSFFIITTALVFLAAGILLLIRAVMLIILMVLSPLAFAGYIMPATRKYAMQWWDKLISQTFFAPFLFLMFFISLKLIQGIQSTLLPVDKGATFVEALQGKESAAYLFINFTLAIGFMIASIIIAKQLGAYGASTMIKWGTTGAKRIGGGAIGLTGRLGRTTIGRTASRLSQSEWLKDRAARGGVAGYAARAGLSGLERTAGSTFDARNVGGVGKKLGIGKGIKGGYTQKLEAQVKAREKRAKTLGTAAPINKEERVQIEGLERLVDQRQQTLVQLESSGASAATIASAQANLKTAQKMLKGHRDAIGRRGSARQRTYATTLATQKRLWVKVPRKNKEAAAKIRKGKTAQEKLTDNVKEMLASDQGFKDSVSGSQE